MASRFKPLRTSARATLWAAAASAVLSVVAGVTLDGGLASLALVALGAFVACALYALLSMSRYAVAGVAAASSSLTIGASLAFLRLLGLAWDQDPNSVTTVSSKDADPYFFGALAAAAVTLAVLFVGAVWPQRRVTRKGSALRRPAQRQPRAASATTRRPGRTPSSVTGRTTTTGRTVTQGAPRSSSGRAQPAKRSSVSATSSRGARQS